MQRYSRTMARHHSQMVCHEASPGGPWDFVTIVHYYYNIQLKHKKGEKNCSLVIGSYAKNILSKVSLSENTIKTRQMV